VNFTVRSRATDYNSRQTMAWQKRTVSSQIKLWPLN